MSGEATARHVTDVVLRRPLKEGLVDLTTNPEFTLSKARDANFGRCLHEDHEVERILQPRLPPVDRASDNNRGAGT